MSANNTVGIQGVSTEYADALNKCRDAGNRLGLEQVVDYYDKWAQEGTYEKLKMRGFTKMDALDASDEMLSIAKAKNIYGRIIHDCMDGHRTDIKDDTYDALTIAGGLGKGRIPTRAMTELIRIVKPGGYVCIIMREENLTKIAEYADRLEPFMKQLAEQGAWTQEERNVVPNHIFGRNGVVFVFRVKQSGAPSVTSTQFTK